MLSASRTPAGAKCNANVFGLCACRILTVVSFAAAYEAIVIGLFNQAEAAKESLFVLLFSVNLLLSPFLSDRPDGRLWGSQQTGAQQAILPSEAQNRKP